MIFRSNPQSLSVDLLLLLLQTYDIYIQSNETRALMRRGEAPMDVETFYNTRFQSVLYSFYMKPLQEAATAERCGDMKVAKSRGKQSSNAARRSSTPRLTGAATQSVRRANAAD